MTTRFLEALKMSAGKQDAALSVARWGVVTSTNPGDATVKVMLQPEEVLTDWLPVLSMGIGNGWGALHIPPVGTQVLCMPDAGDHESYVVLGSTWSTKAQPPVGEEGEFILMHSTGSRVALTNDGKVSVSDQGGCTLTFNNDGTATLAGTLQVVGDVIGGFGGGDQISLQQHIHGNVQNGAGTTNKPTAGT